MTRRLLRLLVAFALITANVPADARPHKRRVPKEKPVSTEPKELPTPDEVPQNFDDVYGGITEEAPTAAEEAARSQEEQAPAEDDPALEALRTIPYAAWTSEKVTSGTVVQSGVTHFDRQRSNPGYNVFTDSRNHVYLMDMTGNVVHTWTLEDTKQCPYAQVQPNGDVVACASGQGVRKADKNGKTLWFAKTGANHDVEVLPDGRVVVCAIKGPVWYMNRWIGREGLAFISKDGQYLKRWDAIPGEPRFLPYHGPTALDTPAASTSTAHYDYYHMNSVKAVPKNAHSATDKRFQEGNLLISLRNTSTIAILDRDTLDIVWTYGGKRKLDNQHMPTMLENGNILVFDNGRFRKWSRVLEIDPIENEVVWKYPEHRDRTFDSTFRGSAQRLPNGNTLICESEKGHAIEVTPTHEIVWEFWSPFIAGNRRRTIYRLTRLTDIDPSKFATQPPIPILELAKQAALAPSSDLPDPETDDIQ